MKNLEKKIIFRVNYSRPKVRRREEEQIMEEKRRRHKPIEAHRREDYGTLWI